MLDSINPWWSGEDSKAIRSWESKPVKWTPPWIKSISLDPFSLNFLIGPRQVGKTTGLHLLIRDRIRAGQNPLSILYVDLDLVWDLEQFRRLIDKYLSLRRAEGIKSSLIVLDEVTSLPGWWKLVKGYVDLGIFDEDVLVLTGSSTLTLRGEAELFPGRRGKGVDVYAWPLSFREFLQVHGIEVKRTGNLAQDMDRLIPMESKVKELFELYMRVGGFPLSINGDPEAEISFIKALIGEVLRLNRSPSLMRAIIGSVLRKAPSPVSYSSIGSEVGTSYKTVRDYLEVLKGLMVFGEAPYLDGSVKHRKERKYFPLDPFIANALIEWTEVTPFPGAAYEWVVQAHLYRLGPIYYYRDGYEVDVIFRDFKVEVKAGKPHRRYPRGVLVVDQENVARFLAVI